MIVKKVMCPNCCNMIKNKPSNLLSHNVRCTANPAIIQRWYKKREPIDLIKLMNSILANIKTEVSCAGDCGMILHVDRDKYKEDQEYYCINCAWGEE